MSIPKKWRTRCVRREIRESQFLKALCQSGHPDCTTKRKCVSRLAIVYSFNKSPILRFIVEIWTSRGLPIPPQFR